MAKKPVKKPAAQKALCADSSYTAVEHLRHALDQLDHYMVEPEIKASLPWSNVRLEILRGIEHFSGEHASCACEERRIAEQKHYDLCMQDRS